MAINANDLHDIVFAALQAYSQGDYKNEMYAPRHMAIMGQKMKAYFEANLEIMYGWSATNPSSGAVDPVVSFTSTVQFGSFDLTVPMNLVGLATKIMAAFGTGVITHPTGFTVSPGSFLIAPLVLPPSSDANTAFMNSIITPICTWAKTLINPASLSGSHAAFVGAAIMSQIK